MPDYLVFGRCLRSELPFPELAETHGHEPRWNLRLASLPIYDDGEVVSDSQLSPSCRIRITQSADRLRFSHSCAGTFELSANGRDIVFDPDSVANINIARTDLVARLLLMYADQDRVTWLHGSAVKLGDSAIAFVGPSGAGKSTLALALATSGATHICDDVLPIEAGEPPVVWPSDRTIRLNDDSKARLASHSNSVRRESDGKFVMTHQSLETGTGGARSCGERRVPLAALYLLAPSCGPAGIAATEATRRLMPPTAAIAALLQHLRLGTIVGREFPAHTMRQLGAIVASVPVFELRIARDWSAIDDVVRDISEWHGVNIGSQSAVLEHV